MKTTLFFTATLLLCAVSATAADRVKAGLWTSQVTSSATKQPTTTSCITAEQARLMNGDLATLRKYLIESTATNTAGRCSVKNVVIQDNRTIVTIVCGKTEVVGTTTYHGTSYESTSSNGITRVGKRIADCP
jgi:hypothetical protein